MKYLIQLVILGVFISPISISAQSEIDSSDNRYIQFSGKVVTSDEGGNVSPLPYVNIGIVGTSRGTFSEIDGFFSLVAEKGDTLHFSRIGFKDAEIVVPDTLQSIYYSWIQIMASDSFLLPEAVIFPWPDRDFYKIEFLALDVTDELRSRAQENLAEQVLSEIREYLPADGGEAYSYEYQRRLTDIKYSGQYKPQNIFNPIAWAQFIKAWKRGDFKKKDDD